MWLDLVSCGEKENDTIEMNKQVVSLFVKRLKSVN